MSVFLFSYNCILLSSSGFSFFILLFKSWIDYDQMNHDKVYGL